MTIRRSRLRFERLEDRTQPALLIVGATAETYLSYSAPTTAFPNEPTASIGHGVGQSLIRFDNLIGTGPNQIPPGSTVKSASLRVWVDAPLAGQGVIAMYRMIAPWDSQTATFASFGGNGVQPDNVEASASDYLPVVGESNGVPTGSVLLRNLHVLMQQWVDGTANNGWLFSSFGFNTGWTYQTPHAADPERRPRLVVEYFLPTTATYTNVVGAPPAANDVSWFAWEQNLVNARLARVPLERRWTYYFSTSGNDATGDGTIDNPWNSLAKMQSVIDASDGNIRLRLRGGDTWRDDAGLTILRSNVTVDSYGTGTPYINGFTRVYSDGWTNVTGDLWKRPEARDIGWVREAANPLAVVYAQQDTSAHVGGYPHSFYRDAAGTDPNSGAVPTLYLNAGPGVDPNAVGGGFEATGYAKSIEVDADNVRLENLRVHGAGIVPEGSGYGLYMVNSNRPFTEFVGVGLEFYYTGYHAIGILGKTSAALLVGCRAGLNTNRYDPTNPGDVGGTSTYVSFSTTGGQEYVMTDCEATYGTLPSFTWGATPGARFIFSDAVFQHNGDGAAAPALNVSVRTRYPKNALQNFGSITLDSVGNGTLAGARTFIVGETYEDIGVNIGRGFANTAWVNCAANFRPVGASAYPFLMSNFYDSWVINGTFRADMRDSISYFGGATSWFNSAQLNWPVNLRLENCSFEAFNLDQNSMTFLYQYGPALGNNASVRNTLVSYEGSRYGALGFTPDSRWTHNAYRFTPTAGFVDLSGDVGAVRLGAAPSAATPSLQSPLVGSGTANGLNYDRDGVARPAGRSDIGPRAGTPIALPATATVIWGTTSRAVTDGSGVGALGVRGFSFTFADDVDVYISSLRITGVLGGDYPTPIFGYNRATHTATWRFSPPMEKDRLTFWFDGLVGFRLTVLPGDVNGDGTVTDADLKQIETGPERPRNDVTGDGRVDYEDLDIARKYFGQSV